MTEADGEAGRQETGTELMFVIICLCNLCATESSETRARLCQALKFTVSDLRLADAYRFDCGYSASIPRLSHSLTMLWVLVEWLGRHW